MLIKSVGYNVTITIMVKKVENMHSKNTFVGLTIMFVMWGLLCQVLAFIHHKHLLSCEKLCSGMLLTIATYRIVNNIKCCSLCGGSLKLQAATTQ